MKKTISSILLLTLVSALCLTGMPVCAEGQEHMDNYSYTVSHIEATDALGRSFESTGGFRKDKYVGLFYFMWLGNQGEPQTKVYDITKLLRTNRDELFSLDKNNKIAPLSYNYFFNEPLYGYYNNADPWVLRKHIEMFIAAGIDFLAIDFTNAIIYQKVLSNLLKVLLEYKEAGWTIPKLVFFTNSSSGTVAGNLYKSYYKKEKYNDLWFRGSSDKPLLIAWENELSDSMKEFFDVRPPQWPEADFNEDGFPYVEKVRPQRLFKNLVSVSVAQHVGGAFSFTEEGPDGNERESWGRGYTSKTPVNGDTEAILRGDNFQEQWDNAIELDPEIIFITGWNEWTALKLQFDWSQSPLWVDTFNTEYSRDVEMTKSSKYVKDGSGKYIEEGYGDNFYLQMVSNIRRFKALKAEESFPEPVSIDINKDVSQWDSVINSYLSIGTVKEARAYYGYVETDELYYEQAAPKNFVQSVKVTYDNDNLYFLLTTKEDPVIGERNLLNLYIGVYGSDKPSWEGLNYCLFRENDNTGKASVEVFSENNVYNLKRIGDASYSIVDNNIQLSVPKKLLGIGDKFAINFKVTDSIEKPEDIMDYYVSGDSLPIGRMTFKYANADKSEIAQSSTKGKIAAIVCATLITAALAAGISVFLLKKRKKPHKM